MYITTVGTQSTVSIETTASIVLLGIHRSHRIFYRRHAVVQLVEALRYRPEGSGALEFFVDIIIPAALWPCG